jgi:hypothetical protein
MKSIISTEDTESGAVVHHMGASQRTNYGTLCGISTDDDQFQWIDTPKGSKINCKQCSAIWNKCKEYRATDISSVLV